jgi:hypothetical protein
MLARGLFIYITRLILRELVLLNKIYLLNKSGILTIKGDK